MYIHEWMSNLGCKRQEIHAQSTLIQRCQNESARAKVKRTFPGFENKKLLVITRNFFNLKKHDDFALSLTAYPKKVSRLYMND